mmetsp:Transcript_16156/g.15542  ORF Transcript_16156/g.15542 Transcript_16156/m.15542 type:complete len:81 (+) Transcript_16156:231-473(+)
MMTAAEIAKRLGQSSIAINYRASELQSARYYDSPPIKDLEVKTNKKSVIEEKYLKGIRFIDNEDYMQEIIGLYPERSKNL